jgi:hypothetical protein
VIRRRFPQARRTTRSSTPRPDIPLSLPRGAG